MDTPLFIKVINPIITDKKKKKSEACVTTIVMDAVQATLPRGHDQPPQSPEGSLATPAAKSGTSG